MRKTTAPDLYRKIAGIEAYLPTLTCDFGTELGWYLSRSLDIGLVWVDFLFKK